MEHTSLCIKKRTQGLATRRGVDTPESISCAKKNDKELHSAMLQIRLDGWQIISIYYSYMVLGFTVSFHRHVYSDHIH